MKYRSALVASCLAVATPALAQVLLSPSTDDQRRFEDQTRPRRGFLTPEEQQRFDERQLQRDEEQGRVRPLEDYTTPRQYEGRATFVGRRPGKCPPNGSVRARVLGNTIDASLTFPIERDAIHGFISGSRFEAKGTFGYVIQGNITDTAINGTAVKQSLLRVSPQKPLGAPIPFIPSPYVPREPAPPPIVQDCTYKIALNRVS